jgi:ATP-binding cassette subfamily B protein
MKTESSAAERIRNLVADMRGSTLVRVMGLMGRRFWPYAASLLLFSAVIAVCFNIVLAFLMKDVLDATMTANRELLIRALVLAAVTFFGGTPLIVALHYICSVYIKRTLTDLRKRLFDHIADLPLSGFEGGHSGDLVSRVTNDLPRIASVYFDQLQTLLLSIFMGSVAVGAIFNIDARLGWVVLFLGLATFASNARFAKPVRTASELVQARTGTLTERLVDLLQSIPVVKMFQLERTIHGTYSDANAAVTDAAVALGNVQAEYLLVNVLFGWLRDLGLLGLGLYFYSRGEISLGSSWAIVMLRSNADLLFQHAGGFIAQVQQSLAAAARVFEVLDRGTEPARYEPDAAASIAVDGLTPSLTTSKLVFEDVNFHYQPIADKVAAEVEAAFVAVL